MVSPIETETAKLASLQVDLLQKVRKGQMTLNQLEWFNGLSLELRDRFTQPDFRAVVRGLSQIVAIEHIIDCDADPLVAEGWNVESHKNGGLFKWDASKVRLHLSKNQKGHKYIQGHELRDELAKKPVLNANVLDYLLTHSELIPEEWKGKCVYFWGTIYRHSDGNLYVRALCWGGECWEWFCTWLAKDFNCNNPAACSRV